MAFDQELDILLRARCTLMVLVTPEEERALAAIKVECERVKRPCLTWDVADKFQRLAGADQSLPSASDAITALEQIDKAEGDGLYVLKDFHDAWTNAQVRRKLRSVAQRLKFTRKSILVTCPVRTLPDELKDEAVVVDFAPPDAAGLELVLQGHLRDPRCEGEPHAAWGARSSSRRHSALRRVRRSASSPRPSCATGCSTTATSQR